MASRRSKRAFTLVEAIVGLTAFSVLMYIIYDMFVGGMKAFQREEGKTESMESTVLAYEIISNDLRRTFYYGYQWYDVGVVPPVTITEPGPEQGASITMPIFGGLDWTKGDLPVAWQGTTTYSLVDSGHPDHKLLALNGKGIPGVKLTKLSFEVKRAEQGKGGKALFFIEIRATGYGERSRDENVLVGLVALDAFTMRSQNPYWVQRPQFVTGGK